MGEVFGKEARGSEVEFTVRNQGKDFVFERSRNLEEAEEGGVEGGATVVDAKFGAFLVIENLDWIKKNGGVERLAILFRSYQKGGIEKVGAALKESGLSRHLREGGGGEID